MEPCTCVGDPEELLAPDSSHWAARGVNHRMEDLPLCLSSSLYIHLSNKNKYILKKKRRSDLHKHEIENYSVVQHVWIPESSMNIIEFKHVRNNMFK